MNFKVLGSIIIVGVFLFFAYGSDDTKTDQVSNNTVDCSNYKGQYSSGYSSGSLCSVMGDNSSCESYVEQYNYGVGTEVLEASDCYCEGFNDGKNGNAKKYSSNSDKSNSNNESDNHTSSEEYKNYELQNNEFEDYSEIEEAERLSSIAEEEERHNKEVNNRIKIFNVSNYLKYMDAENVCLEREMRLPTYEEMMLISKDVDLKNQLQVINSNEGFWSSTDFKITEDKYFTKEFLNNQISEDKKKYKKTFNPFNEKTIITDVEIDKRCFCIY